MTTRGITLNFRPANVARRVPALAMTITMGLTIASAILPSTASTPLHAQVTPPPGGGLPGLPPIQPATPGQGQGQGPAPMSTQAPITGQPLMPNQPLPPTYPNAQQLPALMAPQAGAMTQESRSKRFADRPAVTIREFRSSVQEVLPRAATDMFITALIQTRKFRVLERARLNEGIAQEKLLNQQGATSGQSGEVKYVGAKYMFEGTVSEAQMDQNTTSMGLSIMGLSGKKSYSADTIGIDVRVIEVESGVVADAIKVRKPIKGESTEVGGIGDAITNAVSQRFLGGAVQASGNKEYESKRKDSIDEVMRLCIEEAVQQIAERFSDE